RHTRSYGDWSSDVCSSDLKVSIAAISMGQEIGITPLQLAGLISTMANDGIYVAPRITAATIQPESAPQTIAFHPVNEHRVISSQIGRASCRERVDMSVGEW